MQPGSAPVDLTQLTSLGEADFVLEMVDLFIDTSTKNLEAIRSAAERGDVTALMRAAHTLKGAALGMFANTVAERASTLESAGQSGDLSHVPALLEALTAAFVETSEYLRTATRTAVA